MRRYATPPATAPRVQVGPIPRGYAGTLRTAAHVKRLIRSGVKDFYVRQKAIDILLEQGVRPKNYLGEIEALFQWVQRNVRYTKDPYRLEVLHSARRLLELRAGDCDDMTILLGALMESIGHPVRLVLTGPNPRRPRLFSHIYLEVNHRGQWIPCDATMPHPMGWAPRTPVKQIIPLEEETPYAIHADAIAGHTQCPGAGVAARLVARHRTRRGAVARPSSQDTVESAAQPRTPRAEPMDQTPAALHLGDGPDRARQTEDRAPTPGATAPVGDSATQGDPERSGGRDTGGPEWARSAASGPPGAGPSRRTTQASGAGASRALNGYLRDGGALYRHFNQFDPACMVRIQHCRVMPPVVVQLGDLVGLIYRSDKWQRGTQRTFIHQLTMPARLVSDVGGTQLYLIGGSYRVTPRGIEG